MKQFIPLEAVFFLRVVLFLYFAPVLSYMNNILGLHVCSLFCFVVGVGRPPYIFGPVTHFVCSQGQA
jgi:hypothetical protein